MVKRLKLTVGILLVLLSSLVISKGESRKGSWLGGQEGKLKGGKRGEWGCYKD